MSLARLDDLTTPAAPIEPATTWEYRVLDLRNLDLAAFESQLGEAGRDGWELVCSTHASQAAVLKRQSPTPRGRGPA